MASGSDKRQRNRRVYIRCTGPEYDVMAALANRAGLTLSSYARAVILGEPGPRAVRRPPIERQELARLLGQIGRIGGNINQIARSLNMGDSPDFPALQKAFDDLAEMRILVRQALGVDPGA